MNLNVRLEEVILLMKQHHPAVPVALTSLKLHQTWINWREQIHTGLLKGSNSCIKIRNAYLNRQHGSLKMSLLMSVLIK